MTEENNMQTPDNNSGLTENLSQPTGGGSKTLITVLITVIVVLVAGLIWQMYSAGELRQEVEELREERSELEAEMGEVKEEMEELEQTKEEDLEALSGHNTFASEAYGFAFDYPDELELAENVINFKGFPGFYVSLEVRRGREDIPLGEELVYQYYPNRPREVISDSIEITEIGDHEVLEYDYVDQTTTRYKFLPWREDRVLTFIYKPVGPVMGEEAMERMMKQEEIVEEAIVEMITSLRPIE